MAKGAMSQSSTLVNRGGGGSANSGALSSRAPPTAAGLRKRSSKGFGSPAVSYGPNYLCAIESGKSYGLQSQGLGWNVAVWRCASRHVEFWTDYTSGSVWARSENCWH